MGIQWLRVAEASGTLDSRESIGKVAEKAEQIMNGEAARLLSALTCTKASRSKEERKAQEHK